MRLVYKLNSQLSQIDIIQFALISVGEFFVSEHPDKLVLNVIQSNPNYNELLELAIPDGYKRSVKSGYVYSYQNKSVLGSSYTEIYTEFITPVRMTNNQLDYQKVSFVVVEGEDLSSYILPGYFSAYGPADCTATYNEELTSYLSNSYRPNKTQVKIDGNYIGESVLGLSDDSPGWRIIHASDTLITYPNKDSRFAFVWSNRANYIYS